MKVFCLALITISNVVQQFQIMWNEMTRVHSKNENIGTRGDKFIEYFINTYFKGHFPMTMWNHDDNLEERTNTRVEGNNHNMIFF